MNSKLSSYCSYVAYVGASNICLTQRISGSVGTLKLYILGKQFTCFFVRRGPCRPELVKDTKVRVLGRGNQAAKC
jgi:hypothetical protein